MPSRTESNGNIKLHLLKVKGEIDHFTFFSNFKIIQFFVILVRLKNAFERLWVINLPKLSSAARFLCSLGHSIARNGRLISFYCSNPIVTGLPSMPCCPQPSMICAWRYRKEVHLCPGHAKKRDTFSHCLFFRSFPSEWTVAFLRLFEISSLFSSTLSSAHALFQTMPRALLLSCVNASLFPALEIFLGI